MGPIVTPEELVERLDEVVVCHVGTTMGGVDPIGPYVERHVAGARFASLEDDLAAPAAPILGRHPLPSPESFATTLGRLGIAPVDPVVAYDDRGGAVAARLVWMLRIIGQDASLLDGGLDGWDGPTGSGRGAPRVPRRVEREPVPWPSAAIADADAVADHLDGGGVVIDSRDPARYRGEVEPLDAVAGHVPGAINVAFAGNLVDGRFRPAADLAARFAPVADDPRAIVSCGSGVSACHNALAMEAAGLRRPRVYVGSWSGWSSDPARPVATS
ncbi:sulfurtransferase [Ilumatobacter sp.]|uniref:sulfurtransferase n=1 Tax=Ilumatobacter sp. TaxID=1967498 RepID=UPI003B51F42D